MSVRKDGMVAIFSAAKGSVGISFDGGSFDYWQNDHAEAVSFWKHLKTLSGSQAFSSKAGNEGLRWKQSPMDPWELDPNK